MRRKSPVTVQEWIDSLPAVSNSLANIMNRNESPNRTVPSSSPIRQSFRGMLLRDSSVQSDDASNCSSVESVLELRKPDPEQVLIGLGFGPPKATDYLTRIPQRFLQPSRLNGIDVDKFIEDQARVRMMEENYLHQYIAAYALSFPTSPSQTCDIKESVIKENGNDTNGKTIQSSPVIDSDVKTTTTSRKDKIKKLPKQSAIYPEV